MRRDSPGQPSSGTRTRRCPMEQRVKDMLALLLSAPAASVAILAALAFPGGAGAAVWLGGKAWQAGLPAAWHLKVDGRERSWSKPESGGFGVAAALGVGISVVMLGGWFLLGSKYLDRELIRGMLEPYGLLNPWVYLAVFLWWVLFNSVMEEYLFRWFIFSKIEGLVGGRLAVPLTGLAFTSHHTLAMLVLFPWWANLLASLGLFTGGCIWSWIYLRYRSIWPAYLSPAIVDVTMFALGGYILFG